MEAEISICYKKKEEAKAVAKAVSPDNMKAPEGLFIRTTVQGIRVLTKIKCKKRFETFISTIDDLLNAVSVAEKSLAAVRKRVFLDED